MPIVDIEIVSDGAVEPAETPALALADLLGATFGTPAGQTWIRLRYLSRSCYAENQSSVPNGLLPVFVAVQHAHPPTGDALAAQAKAITSAVAQCLACTPERVHVLYTPPGAGRQAFGGRLVR
jgi:phenylpyruvate tautomerase PptA (4-oxalocrotonate tautomerase family)